MEAKRLLDEGKLGEAIAQLTSELRSRPADLPGRIFLFELLGFAGDLARAGKQLDAIGHLDHDPHAMIGTQLYRGLIEAEEKRARLFAEGLRPRFLLEPPESARLALEALELCRLGRAGEARERLDRAEASRRPVAGTAGGVAFDDLRDADDILAPVLEVFAPAGYCWVPWEQIQYLEIPPPKQLRDLLWTPARIASFDGQLGEVFLPSLYPGSHAHPDESVRLGRATDWRDAGAGIVRGAGRKLLMIGQEARTLLELGEVRFHAPAEGAEPSAAPTAEDRP